MSFLRRHKLIVRYFGGGMSTPEQQELFERMAHDTRLKELFEEERCIDEAMAHDRDAMPKISIELPPALATKLNDSASMPSGDGSAAPSARRPRVRPRLPGGGAGKFGGAAWLITAAVGITAFVLWVFVFQQDQVIYEYYEVKAPDDGPFLYDSAHHAGLKTWQAVPHSDSFEVHASSLASLPSEVLLSGVVGAGEAASQSTGGQSTGGRDTAGRRSQGMKEGGDLPVTIPSQALRDHLRREAGKGSTRADQNDTAARGAIRSVP